ncbi:MAG: hypothetical protein ACLQG3_03470 [Terracidiphilus sp.]
MASAPAAAAAPAPTPQVAGYPAAPPAFALPPAAPPMAPYPPYYPAPGQIPIVIMPQPVPKHHGWIWAAIIVAGILCGLYYLGSYEQNRTQPLQNPGQQGGPNAALVQQQLFTAQWRVTNGDVQLYNQVWKNRSTVAIASATAECDQADQNGAVLAKKSIDLSVQSGQPVQPEDTAQFDDLDIGQAAQGLSQVNCGVVGATPVQ